MSYLPFTCVLLSDLQLAPTTAKYMRLEYLKKKTFNRNWDCFGVAPAPALDCNYFVGIIVLYSKIMLPIDISVSFQSPFYVQTIFYRHVGYSQSLYGTT